LPLGAGGGETVVAGNGEGGSFLPSFKEVFERGEGGEGKLSMRESRKRGKTREGGLFFSLWCTGWKDVCG